LESATADEDVDCVFLGQVVVVSGRSGHNQRVNGIFNELPQNYGAFPAFFDNQKHMYLYRRIDQPSWVISNRLGPAPRSGRGIVFAEVEDEAAQPYLVTKHWTISAWGPRSAEIDPNMTVFLRPDFLQNGPPPQTLTVRSEIHPEVVGVFALEEGRLVRGQVLYSMAGKDPSSCEMHIFWDGERWCIDSTLPDDANPKPASLSSCSTVCSQRRANTGRNFPEDAVWTSVEVLRGACERIDASLLASLRGKRAELAHSFS
jgi:hypothetical protein